ERTTLDDRADEAVAAYRERMDAFMLQDGAAAALALVAEANAFVGDRAPWKLAKDPERAAELDAVLASLVRTLAVSTALLSPFMPVKMAELWGALGSPEPVPALHAVTAISPAGWTVRAGGVLFPRPDLVSA